MVYHSMVYHAFSTELVAGRVT